MALVMWSVRLGCHHNSAVPVSEWTGLCFGSARTFCAASIRVQAAPQGSIVRAQQGDLHGAQAPGLLGKGTLSWLLANWPLANCRGPLLDGLRQPSFWGSEL